jgi:membrane peptidoglycan carboxypeptidase
MGIKFRAKSDAVIANNKEGADQWGAFTLGVSATTPLDLANAYATLAADGKYCEPNPVQAIIAPDGAKLDVAAPRCRKAVDVEVARAAVDAARCPLGDRSSVSHCNGATAPGVRDTVGFPVAGKSGTTDSEKTASLVTMTKQLAVAGIMADPDWAETSHDMEHDIVNPAVYETLRDGMRAMKVKAKNFTPPSGDKMINGDQRSIPNVECLSVDAAQSRLKGAGFDVDVDRIPVDSKCPEGAVAGTSPDGRTIKGGVVVIEVSNGKGAAVPGGTGPPRRGGPGG